MNSKLHFVYPYKPGSNSARDLARALEVRRISHTNSRFRGGEHKTIINWGASRLPEQVALCSVLNSPENVGHASNKLNFFRAVEDYARVPQYTTNYEEALEALNDDHNLTVFGRTVLNGHSGQGIVAIRHDNYMTVHRNEHRLPTIPLFVWYVPKRQEYRVHVFQGQVVDVQRKARSRDVPDDQVNWQIRNHDNGFIFARDGEALGDVPDDVINQSVQAVNACGLDFGAVDVVFNDRQQLAYVLEVNTSPGLTGTTLGGYVHRFQELLG